MFYRVKSMLSVNKLEIKKIYQRLANFKINTNKRGIIKQEKNAF